MSTKLNVERSTLLAKALHAASITGVQIEIKDGKLTSGGSVLLVNYKVPGVPNMVLTNYFAETVANYVHGKEILFKQDKVGYSFACSGVTLRIPKAATTEQQDWDNVYLKPLLVNNDLLSFKTDELKLLGAYRQSHLADRITFCRADGFNTARIIQGWSSHAYSWILFDEPKPVATPSKDFSVTLATDDFFNVLKLMRDETTTLRLDLSSRPKPAPVLVTDSISGLTAVFAQIRA